MNKLARKSHSIAAASVTALCDIALIALAVTACALAIPTQAHAYVDPSVMTYTIQALAGVAVALSTVIGVLWRRARKKMYKTLNIDENKNKLVEPNVSRISPPQKATTDSSALAPNSFGEKAKQNSDIKYTPDRWFKRILPAALVSIFAVATLLVVAPYEIVASNSSSLMFRLDAIWVPVALSALPIAALLTAALVAIRGKAFKIACGCVLAFGLCCYAQALFMNFALPAANGVPVEWQYYKTVTVQSALLWIAIFALVVTFSVKCTWKMSQVMPFIAAAMIFIQGVGVTSLFLDQPAAGDDEATLARKGAEQILTSDGLFEVAPQNNVIAFVLDTVDTQHLQALTKIYPDKFGEFTDFTMFTDVSGSMSPTRYGAGFLYNAQIPEHGEKFTKYWDERFQRSNFIQDISAQDYSVDLYTDSLHNGQKFIAPYVDNIHPITEKLPITSPGNIVAVLWKCSMYRDMPWILKPPFWFYTEEVNDSVELEGDISKLSVPYRMNDSKYYSDLHTNGLKIADKGKKGAFKFIHLLGSHYPYVMNEKCEPVANPEDSNLDLQTLGTVRIVSDYLKMLKDLGVYDDATIIVTSDHGYFDYAPDMFEIPRATSPIMLVKPANPEAPGAPLAYSDVPITHGAFHPTVIDAIGGDTSAYGVPALEAQRSDDPRYYYYTMHDGKLDHYIMEYEINGPVSDFNNWRPTGERWDVKMSKWD